MSKSLYAVCQLLQPALLSVFDAAMEKYPSLSVKYTGTLVSLSFDFCSDDLVLSAFNKRFVLFMRNEILDNTYKADFYPRVMKIILAHVPKPHVQYKPHPKIKRARHPMP